MTVNNRAPCLTLLAVVLPVLCIASQPFERYQTIIDRKPFGPEPVNFNPEAAPGSPEANAAGAEMTEEQRTVEEQQLAAKVRVSMINVTPAGAVAIGFTDTSVNPAENYYLIVGGSQNGWTVKNADPSTESVTLEKGGIEVTVKLGETSGGGNVRGGKKSNVHRPMILPAITKDIAAPEMESSQGVAVESPRLGGLARLRMKRAKMNEAARIAAEKKKQAEVAAAVEREEREAREAEEKRAREEREAREAEERAQQREALRQIQEQLKREREAREAARLNEQNREEQSEANNIE